VEPAMTLGMVMVLIIGTLFVCLSLFPWSGYRG
jgi:hypothetical protein